MEIKPDRTAYRQKVILSDDLTGAMDAGVQMSKCGKNINVKILGMSQANSGNIDDILVLDTESRNVLPGAAFSTLLELVKSLKASGKEVIYKKIDSTLRGNVGKELEAIIYSGISNMIALVPALPQNGRTTVGGYHYLNGRLLGESDLSKDPFSPVKSSYIPDLISFQTDLPTGLITIGEVRRGKEHLCSRFECLYSEGIKIIVSDAETVEDLESIADALDECKIKILPCGSAGLLSLLRISKEQMKKQKKEGINELKNKTSPFLVICGSPAKASKEQVRVAQENGMELLRLSSYGENVDSLKEKARNILKSGKDLIVDGSGDGKNEIAMLYKGDLKSLNADSEKIQEALANITADMVCCVPLLAMMIIGGDTAAAICRKLGADSIKIAGEVEPLVPWGSLMGGSAENLKIVTKAGGFGSEMIILSTAAYLRGV